MFEKVGEFSAEIIKILNLKIPVGTEILLSPSTLDHIKKDHPDVKGDHKNIISGIISEPSCVSFREKDGTIGFYKEYSTGEQYYLDLPVRSSTKGEFFVRTLHFVKTKRFNWYIEQGKIIRIDKFKDI